jgi:hypothetical protein
MDTDTYMHSFRESIFRAVIETLQLPSGSRGLDAGRGFRSLLKHKSS